MTAVHRVVVVDDSPTARALLRSILASDPDIDVVGEAANGSEAVQLVSLVQPSVVVMDIDMPGTDGFEATKRIMIEQPTPIVIVTGTDDPLEVEVGLKAVGAGALTAVAKPPGPSSPAHAVESARLIRLVKALADVKVVRHRRAFASQLDTARNHTAEPRRSDPRAGRIVGVAASTGGPAALYRFLGGLPRELDVPVLVVQHIAGGFVEGLARWLATATVLPVNVARGHVSLRAGEVYLAPDDRHLTVRDGRIALSAAAPLGGFRPSATVLFRSLAESHGALAVAVVLTGMGEDGVDGAALVHAAGGVVLAQDAESCVVYGMPHAVAQRGIADFVGPVQELAVRVADITSKEQSSS